MRLIAIGDIHGCLRELKELLEIIKPTPDDRLIFMGDYIDRGPDSVGVVKYLFTEKTELNSVKLMGNHEALFLFAFKEWEKDFGQTTILSMEFHGYNPTLKLLREKLAQTKLSHTEGGFLFVHGGIRDEGLEQTPHEEVLQLRNAHAYRGKIPLVVGHTPIIHAVKYANAVNVDG